ncbi:hypothetical protein C8F04DRAFT_687926 [Mycena alexandri]|uniref:Uncharacterized protein n=1 Tax=Mycena alexandri TaxID=1745969 RepID=A0AAD6TDN0_9AGAR|nr:hypothetical protein C8F04DRAFT_687926 [Mycena alexandri]
MWALSISKPSFSLWTVIGSLFRMSFTVLDTRLMDIWTKDGPRAISMAVTEIANFGKAPGKQLENTHVLTFSKGYLLFLARFRAEITSETHRARHARRRCCKYFCINVDSGRCK